MKCTICNEQSLDGAGLCYLHKKYNDGLTGPYFEKLYDLIYWKETVLLEWNELEYNKITVSCSPRVEVQKMNRKTLDKVRSQVMQDVMRTKADLSMYQNLVTKMAYKFAARSNHSFLELYNEGMFALSKLERKVSSKTDPKMVSSFVRQSLHGAMLNYTNNRTEIKTTLPVIDDIARDDKPLVDEQYIAEEQEAKHVGVLTLLRKRLNSRQLKVFKNMFLKHMKTRKQLAKHLGISPQAVSKATKAIYEKGKEMGYE